MQYRTLFFSDIHLGSRDAQAEAFLSFIKDRSFEKIYIVGDFIDFWALKKGGSNWIQSHNDVLQKILKRHRKGTEISWIVGNHDEFMCQFNQVSFGGIDIKLNDKHIGADGKSYYIMHGHELDVVMKYAKWLMHLGASAYNFLLWLNPMVRPMARFFGMRNFSLSKYLKYKAKSAVKFIGDFENGIVLYAKQNNCDGVICGHLHCPSMKNIDGILYLNTGDWIESLSCIVEHMDGTMELFQFDINKITQKEVIRSTNKHEECVEKRRNKTK